MIGPFSRILARYISAALVSYGIFSAPDAVAIEPDIAVALGAIIAATTETAYVLARRLGWSK